MSTVLSTFGFEVFNGFEVWLALYPPAGGHAPMALYIHVLGGFEGFGFINHMGFAGLDG